MEESVTELFDAVITGAGPAGSTLARTLARGGLRVLLVEKDTPGSRRVCGGFAGPEISDFFSSVGLAARFESLPKNAIHRVRITGTRTGALDTPFIKGPGWSVDRSAFDSWLAREAVNEGAKLLNHSTVISAKKSSGVWQLTVDENKKICRIKSRFFIVASGRRKPEFPDRKKIFFACKTVYENAPIPADRVTLHFVRKGHIGLNPLGGGKTSMCLYVESSYLKSCGGDLDQMMENLKLANPNLKTDMLDAQRVTEWQTCAAEPDQRKIFYRDGVFFAGDALTMVNPIIGGGMSIATASAGILGTLIIDGIVKNKTDKQIACEYKKAWVKRFEKRVNLASSLGWIERSRILSGAAFSLISLIPDFLSHLVHSTRKDPFLSAARKFSLS